MLKCPRCGSQNFVSSYVILQHRVEWVEDDRIRGFTTRPYVCLECAFEFIPLSESVHEEN